MLRSKQFLTILTLFTLVIAGVAAVGRPDDEFKNLKILPKDITSDKLDSIMKSYNKALGVKCDFCHAKAKDLPDSLDYASDEEPFKEDARKMMRMTIDINKKYFNYNKKKHAESLTVINCMTCHRGESYPDDVK